MIYKNGNLILKVLQPLIEEIQKVTGKNIGAIYKGAKLVWLTIYDAIRSCYGSGRWIKNLNWILDDVWKNN